MGDAEGRSQKVKQGSTILGPEKFDTSDSVGELLVTNINSGKGLIAARGGGGKTEL